MFKDGEPSHHLKISMVDGDSLSFKFHHISTQVRQLGVVDDFLRRQHHFCPINFVEKVLKW